MKNDNTRLEPELPRPLRVEKIATKGVEESITATPQERVALAKRFDLIEVKSLTAKLTVTPKQAGMNFEVAGRFTVEVVQRCVVTLEPLPARIAQPIHVYFAAPGFIDNVTSERTLDEEDMEPITDGIIDLGELVAQHLGLALDPYPRKSDMPPVDAEFGKSEAKISPFAKLAALKDKPKE